VLGKKLKIFLCALVFFSTVSSVFAVEEYVSQAYKEIDQVFVDKTEEILNDILQKYQDDKNYYLIENYAQKKIRRLILNDEYTFAMSAIVVVIENDLDNEEALEMYSLISDAFEEQKRQKELQKEREQKEIVRIEGEKNKQKGNVEKAYVASATAAGETVYVTGAETRLTSNYWKVDFGIIDFANIVDKPNNIMGFNYGVSGAYSYEYISEKKTLGFDLDASFKFLALGDTASTVPVMGDFGVVPKIAFNKVSENMFVRFGLGGVITMATSSADENAMSDFYSPLVGIGFEKIPVGSMKMGFYADYLAGHLLYKDIKFAMAGGADLAIPFGETERVTMNLTIGLKDQLFMKSTGVENRASVILAIGANNVVR